MNLRASAATDIGNIRQENEDSYLCEHALGLYGVADGIGGLPAGAQASAAAVSAYADWLRRQPPGGPVSHSAGLREVNDRVFMLGRRISPRHGIGTTLTLAHFAGRDVHIVHAGDSFLFRLRGGAIEPLTVEHNVENELRARAARGEPVFAAGENRAALTRCVGQPPPLNGDVSTHEVKSGDRYVLCTDGVTRCIAPDEIAGLITAATQPAEVAEALVLLARERGGLDNATAVVVFAD